MSKLNNVSNIQKIGLLLVIIILLITNLKLRSFDQHKKSIPTLIPDQRIIIVKAPENLGRLVQTHVRKILKKGYALDISDEDFYHGHILRVSSKKYIYNSLNEFILDLGMILYHTDEKTNRWESQVGGKIPRSIISEGEEVKPAITIFNLENKKDFPWEEFAPFYLDYGTITTYDIIKKLSYLDNGTCLNTGTKRPQIIINKIPFIISFQFKIQKDTKGRYSTPVEKFEVLMRLEREDWWLLYEAE